MPLIGSTIAQGQRQKDSEAEWYGGRRSWTSDKDRHCEIVWKSLRKV